MKLLSYADFIIEAGVPVANNRDFSLYEGALYTCACGSTHLFSQYSSQLYGSTGAKAKFMAQCPVNENALTLIITQTKLLILFDRFISLAGHVAN